VIHELLKLDPRPPEASMENGEDTSSEIEAKPPADDASLKALTEYWDAQADEQENQGGERTLPSGKVGRVCLGFRRARPRSRRLEARTRFRAAQNSRRSQGEANLALRPSVWVYDFDSVFTPWPSA
jgi:hypothetical protein